MSLFFFTFLYFKSDFSKELKTTGGFHSFSFDIKAHVFFLTKSFNPFAPSLIPLTNFYNLL